MVVVLDVIGFSRQHLHQEIIWSINWIQVKIDQCYAGCLYDSHDLRKFGIVQEWDRRSAKDRYRFTNTDQFSNNSLQAA